MDWRKRLIAYVQAYTVDQGRQPIAALNPFAPGRIDNS